MSFYILSIDIPVPDFHYPQEWNKKGKRRKMEINYHTMHLSFTYTVYLVYQSQKSYPCIRS